MPASSYYKTSLHLTFTREEKKETTGLFSMIHDGGKVDFVDAKEERRANVPWFFIELIFLRMSPSSLGQDQMNGQRVLPWQLQIGARYRTRQMQWISWWGSCALL